MKKIYFVFVIAAILTTSVFAQSREAAIQEFKELKQKASKLEKSILQLSPEDLETAAAENLNVFRLLPREKYDNNLFNTRGGGAFYSFTKKSHSYNEIPEIGLGQNNLMGGGFSGANYGFIADLGKTEIESAEQTPEAIFILKYQSARFEKDARNEHRKFWNFKENGISLSNYSPAIAGNTYLLRAVTFDKADTFVAFKIHRQDTDGSLIIFWKLVKEFEKPVLIRDETAGK